MELAADRPGSTSARLLAAAPPLALFVAIHGHDLLLYAGGRPRAADLAAGAVGLALVALPVAGWVRQPSWFWSWLGHALLILVGTAFYAGLVIGSLALVQLAPLALAGWQQVPWQLSPAVTLAVALVAAALALTPAGRPAGASLAVVGFICALGVAALGDGVPLPARYLVTGSFAVAGVAALLVIEAAPVASRGRVAAGAGTLLLAVYVALRLSYPLPLAERPPLLALGLLWPLLLALCLWVRALFPRFAS